MLNADKMGGPHWHKEGYWRQTFSNKEESNLPWPQWDGGTGGPPWFGKAEFLKALALIESNAQALQCKGFSTCRLCQQPNGAVTFRHEWNDVNWEWPSGFSHYVKEHNVRPSQAFVEFVLAAAKMHQ